MNHILGSRASEAYLITGGAGFIGSNIASALHTAGAKIILCDRFRCDQKWQNLRNIALFDVVPPENLTTWLNANSGEISGIIHMGAISATTESDVDKIIKNNFLLSLELWRFATQFKIPFIYASSAATYGGGECGFVDDENLENMSRLRPLNPYGWSKLLVDQRFLYDVVNDNPRPPQWVGLKFFNVYGPNEHHKGDMRSVINKIYPTVKGEKEISLFRSHIPEYKDGEQLRDFIYVKDCVKIILWLLDNKSVSGIFNVGTGQPRSFKDLAVSLSKVLNKNLNIRYIDMPLEIRDRYQYFTKAEMKKIYNAGYHQAFYSLEEGIADYVASDLINL